MKMTGPCRVMRHSVTALRLEMVPATSIVGRRSADGTQINQVYLIVVVKALNAVLGEPGFEFVADCNGQCYYGFFFDRWMGDGFCDQGEYGLSLNCEAHQFDQGDCE